MMYKTKSFWSRCRAILLKWLYRIYVLTLRITISGLDDTKKVLQESQSGVIFLLWHDSLFVSLFLEKLSKDHPICALISKSRDGTIPSDFALQFNFSVLRGGHKERGQAHRICCRLLSQGTNLLITPDGPRGPRRELKPGALFAAQKAQAPLIPIVYTASREWRLKSWDRFRIPLPFSRVQLAFLPPAAASDGAETIMQNMAQPKRECEKE